MPTALELLCYLSIKYDGYFRVYRIVEQIKCCFNQKVVSLSLKPNASAVPDFSYVKVVHMLCQIIVHISLVIFLSSLAILYHLCILSNWRLISFTEAAIDWSSIVIYLE